MSERLTLSKVQSIAISESERAQKYTQLYINQLHIRIQSFQKDIEKATKEMHSLSEEVLASKDLADKRYKNTLATVVSEFNVKPPWSAKVVFDETETPIAIDIGDPEELGGD